MNKTNIPAHRKAVASQVQGGSSETPLQDPQPKPKAKPKSKPDPAQASTAIKEG